MRAFALILMVGCAVALLSACGSDGSPGPDAIFHNGTVITMDAADRESTAIAVADGKIVAVGSDDEVLELEVSGTETVDLDGRTVLPGFVDPHTHILNDADQQGMTLEEAHDLAFEHGITAIGNLYADNGFVSELTALNDEGGLRVRTSLYLSRTTNCGEDEGDWYTSHPPATDPLLMLRTVGVKLFTDGGSCELPAYSPDLGTLWFTQEQMNRFVAEAAALGYQVAIHAIGDRGIEQAQNALESVLAGAPNDLRHRIEHNSAIRPDLLPRYAEIGIVPVISSYAGACEIFYTGEPFVGPENTSWLQPWRQLLDSGAEHVTWHSDYPYTSTDPFVHLFGLVTGKQIAGEGGLDENLAEGVEPGDVCEPEEWAVPKTIDVDEGLRMMTIDAAYALGQESVIGSLEEGKLADLVVVSENPLTVEPDAIVDIDVLVTMVGGSMVYCGPEAGELCDDVGRMP